MEGEREEEERRNGIRKGKQKEKGRWIERG